MIIMKHKKFSLKMPKGYSQPIQLSVLMLNILGIIMIVSAQMSTKNGTSTMELLRAGIKEMGFFVVSYFLMIMVARYFKMSKFKKYFPLLLALMYILLLLTRAPIIGIEIFGAAAWLNFGLFTIQPSEFAKVFIIIMLALFLGDKKFKKVNKIREIWLKPFVIILIMTLIIVLYQKDLGSAVILCAIAYVCYLVPSHRKSTKIQSFLILFLGLGFLLIMLISTETGLAFAEKILNGIGASPYMLDRFHTAANPFADRYNTSNQVFNALAAFSNGGLIGKGLGQGFIKLSYLPVTDSDFILAVIVEEMGMLGFLFVFTCYATLVYQLFKYAMLAKKEQDKIILMGTMAYIFMHFIFNVGGVTGFIPLTGVPLLLLSAGGSSKMAIMMAIGLSQQSIARIRKEKTVPKPVDKQVREVSIHANR